MSDKIHISFEKNSPTKAGAVGGGRAPPPPSGTAAGVAAVAAAAAATAMDPSCANMKNGADSSATTAELSAHKATEDGGVANAEDVIDGNMEPPEFYDNKIWREWECLRNKTGQIMSPEFCYSFDPNNLIKYAKNVNRTVTFKKYYPVNNKKKQPKNPQPLYI